MKWFWTVIALLVVLTIVIWIPKPESGARIASEPGTPRFTPNVAQPPPPPTPFTPPPHPQETNASDQDVLATLLKDLEASYKARSATPDATRVTAAVTGIGAGPAIHAPAPPPQVAAKANAAPGTMITSESGPKVQHNADGSMLIDDRFALRGDGSEGDPYRITWEYLVSAQETYSPRLDMYEMPARITMLDGKHVQITGYLFVPLYRTETTEMMVMRNMWDGCCIGLPPTSYDAIEVKLKQPLSMQERRFATSGMLSGTLKVDPYVQGSWLLGLYLVEDGTVDFEL